MEPAGSSSLSLHDRAGRVGAPLAVGVDDEAPSGLADPGGAMPTALVFLAEGLPSVSACDAAGRLILATPQADYDEEPAAGRSRS